MSDKPVTIRKPQETAPEATASQLARGLTAMQKRFAECLSYGMSQTEAAREAGYQGNDSVLAVAGSKLVRNGKVRAYLDALLAPGALSEAEIINSLSTVARASWEDFLHIPEGGEDGKDEDVRVDLGKALRRGQLAALKKFKQKVTSRFDEEGNEIRTAQLEIELHDPLRAHKMMIDLLGIGKQQDEQPGGTSASEQRLMLVAKKMQVVLSN